MSDVLPSTEQLDQIVLAIPGVDALYSAAPLGAAVGEAVGTAVKALTGRPDAPRSVHVTLKNDALVVSVKIGVEDGHAAADVCGHVHDALLNHLAQNGQHEVAEIAVTVARIG